MGRHSRDRNRSPRAKITKKDLYKRIEKLENEFLKTNRHRSRPRLSVSNSRSRSPPRRRRSPSPRARGSRRSMSYISDGEGRSPSGANSHASYSGTGRVSHGPADAFVDGHSPRGLESNNFIIPEAEQDAGANSNVLTIHNDIILSEDTLNILGENPEKSTAAEYSLHSAVAVRWSHILKHGMGKEEQEKILDRHGTPTNCKELVPPLINPEVKAVMSTTHSTRDKTHSDYQSQIGRGLTALGKALSEILSKEENMPKDLREKILRDMTDAGRIFSSLFHEISSIRRYLISPVLSKPVKDMIEGTSPGEYLFGPDLGERVKAAKSLERVGRELRPAGQTTASGIVIQPRHSLSFPRKRGGGGDRPSTSSMLNSRRPAHQRREMRQFRGQPSRNAKPYHKRR